MSLFCEEGPPILTVMTREVLTAKPDETVGSVVKRMAEKGAGSVVVVNDEGKPIGIFTERDLLVKVVGEGRSLDAKLSEVMTPDPIVAKPDWSLARALEIMVHYGFRHLPVVGDDGRLVGIVSIKDLAKALSGEIDVDELHAAG
ncbi:MAG: CBS domain-containing protein [Desulfurococcales archaeon]|nr:CBS domain-containing protein [Desulfurococcales archaeon]